MPEKPTSNPEVAAHDEIKEGETGNSYTEVLERFKSKRGTRDFFDWTNDIVAAIHNWDAATIQNYQENYPGWTRNDFVRLLDDLEVPHDSTEQILKTIEIPKKINPEKAGWLENLIKQAAFQEGVIKGKIEFFQNKKQNDTTSDSLEKELADIQNEVERLQQERQAMSFIERNVTKRSIFEGLNKKIGELQLSVVELQQKIEADPLEARKVRYQSRIEEEGAFFTRVEQTKLQELQNRIEKLKIELGLK